MTKTSRNGSILFLIGSEVLMLYCDAISFLNSLASARHGSDKLLQQFCIQSTQISTYSIEQVIRISEFLVSEPSLDLFPQISDGVEVRKLWRLLHHLQFLVYELFLHTFCRIF